ncbi:MAG TPA: aldehyde dehydrogenase family protein, partial [Novosphingobium sp.]|nr:aldehyde dehydrogenase family protein [Novosphingobium sp.]
MDGLMSFTLPLSRDVFFIGGEWVAPSSPEMISIISPRTEEVVGTVPAGQRGDIDRAVAAARKAFDHGPWPRMSVEERGAIMRKVAAYMRERGPEVAKLVSTEMGGPMS